ncbi:uncharacterized protein BT62DRAFT_271091 [Guyanagaster necrorhizus]|uniref:Uncharacterized protein n=1 Tax=Guyanagaster necrorhizus TaxID=856835 RepID=A0A9P8AXS4_9AGAR|nr:uncharacterized protein BT62DRAFT_271091 [Guyanagaster necrorhizus MCA 3950]KAG7451908.1 hypothetical protein BT62DRAFT_271091 [Guyanagaster necrorhizus MCA 3950]
MFLFKSSSRRRIHDRTTTFDPGPYPFLQRLVFHNQYFWVYKSTDRRSRIYCASFRTVKEELTIPCSCGVLCSQALILTLLHSSPSTHDRKRGIQNQRHS